MTRHSELILHKVRGALEPPAKARRLLFEVRSQSVTRIDLTVLKVLLSENNERGVFITVDRPDKHLIGILERQNLAPPEGAGQPRKRLFIAGAMFSPAIFVDKLLSQLSDARKGPSLQEEMQGMGFVMLDNFGSLGVYNGPRAIAVFIERVMVLLGLFPSLRFLTCAPRGSIGGLGPAVEGFFEQTIEIPDAWFAE